MGASRERALRRAQTVKAKAWVARLTLHLGAIKREFVRGKLDPRRPGGAYVYYQLHSGNVYEVSSPTGPFTADRYYCRVTAAGEIERLSDEDIKSLLH